MLNMKNQECKPINIILYSRYENCEALGIYVQGPILKEKAKNINATLGKPKLEDSKPPDGWLAKWKFTVFDRSKYLENLRTSLKLL